MLMLGWIVLVAGVASVEFAPVPRPVPHMAVLGAGAIVALVIMLVLPEPRPVKQERQTRVTFWDQHVNLLDAASRLPAVEHATPQADDAYRSHAIAA